MIPIDISNNIDFCVPTPFLDRKFIIKILAESSTIDIFSSSKKIVGGGIYIPEYGDVLF